MEKPSHRPFETFARLTTVGALIVAGSVAVDKLNDDRPAYIDGLVCSVPLEGGESPHVLAEKSAMRADAETVIQRSQFLNPDAVLRYTEGDEQHFDGYFNVMLANPEDTEPQNRPYLERSDSSCAINQEYEELVSTFPEIEASGKILRSTIALQERRSSGDEFQNWRCGGVAISPNQILLASSEYVGASSHACVGLSRGEADDEAVRIVNDRDVDQFRIIQTAGLELDFVEIADDYEPREGDVLIYSGYTRGGSRDFFRTEVIGSRDGRLLVAGNIDQIEPSPVYSNADIQYEETASGSGGLFTLDGRLVGVLENTSQYQNIDRSTYSDEYAERIREHNDSLHEMVESYGYDNTSFYTDDRQFILALRAHSDVATSGKGQ